MPGFSHNLGFTSIIFPLAWGRPEHERQGAQFATSRDGDDVGRAADGEIFEDRNLAELRGPRWGLNYGAQVISIFVGIPPPKWWMIGLPHDSTENPREISCITWKIMETSMKMLENPSRFLEFRRVFSVERWRWWRSWEILQVFSCIQARFRSLFSFFFMSKK